jgi:hypothetical protein
VGLGAGKQAQYTYSRVRLFCAWTAFLSSAESFIISADNPSDLLCSLISWSYRKESMCYSKPMTILVTIDNESSSKPKKIQKAPALTFRERFSVTNSGEFEMLLSDWVLILLTFNRLACSSLSFSK